MTNSGTRHIAILGAGPMGLEAALYARNLGYSVTVYDKGRIGANMRAWGHIRLFSPWSYNRSPLGIRRLTEHGGADGALDESACPTGAEMVSEYLMPLAELPELRDSVHEHSEVVACARAHLLKKDIGAAVHRSRQPFRLLIRDATGKERIDTADVVIDATGVFGMHNHLGEGGIPAPGETDLEHDIEFDPPDVLGAARERFAGRHTIVVGSGFSGATTAVALAQLIAEVPGTRVSWVCRSEQAHPLKAIENDPLHERRELTEAGNRLATHPPAGFDYLGGYAVGALARAGSAFEITLHDRAGNARLLAGDRIVANVGYHPDERIYRQLHVHECYATFGPIDLAASLMAAGDVDCLAVQAGGADLLRNPEPDFYIVGAKSYGTNPTFIMRLGHEHIIQLFSLIGNDAALNLYAA